MKMIDMHCDTLLGTGYGEEIDLYENNKAVDFKRLKAAGFTAQFYAMCLMPEESFLAKGMKNQVMPTLWMHCRDASIKIWKNTAIMLPLQATWTICSATKRKARFPAS